MFSSSLSREPKVLNKSLFSSLISFILSLRLDWNSFNLSSLPLKLSRSPLNISIVGLTTSANWESSLPKPSIFSSTISIVFESLPSISDSAGLEMSVNFFSMLFSTFKLSFSWKFLILPRFFSNLPICSFIISMAGFIVFSN